MPVVRIDDPSDPRLADYRDLTDVALRRRTEPAEGLYIAESAKVIGRAVAAGHRPRSVLVQEKWLADAERNGGRNAANAFGKSASELTAALGAKEPSGG